MYLKMTESGAGYKQPVYTTDIQKVDNDMHVALQFVKLDTAAQCVAPFCVCLCMCIQYVFPCINASLMCVCTHLCVSLL